MKKKLKLDSLKVNSFITHLSSVTVQTIKGGEIYSADGRCQKESFRCPTHNCRQSLELIKCPPSVKGNCDYVKWN